MNSVSYVWQCDFCPCRLGQHYNFAHGAEIPKGGPLPEGWSIVNGRYVCHGHEIEVKERPGPDPSVDAPLFVTERKGFEGGA